MSYIYVIWLSVAQSVFSEKEVIDLSNYRVCRRSLGKIGQLANRTSSHVSGPIKKISYKASTPVSSGKEILRHQQITRRASQIGS